MMRMLLGAHSLDSARTLRRDGTRLRQFHPSFPVGYPQQGAPWKLGAPGTRIPFTSRDLCSGWMSPSPLYHPLRPGGCGRMEGRSGKWRKLEVHRWKPHLARMTLQGPAPSRAPLPCRAFLLSAGPLGLKQAETIGTNISNYMITLDIGEWNVLINVRLFCHFQSFDFQPSFKTALCTTDELLKTVLEWYFFFPS